MMTQKMDIQPFWQKYEWDPEGLPGEKEGN